MAATQPPPETRLWNSGSQPLVPHEIGWGNGAVPPGGSFLTADPESYGPPWIMDPEADQRLQQEEQQAQQAAQRAQETRSATPAPRVAIPSIAPPLPPVAPQNVLPTPPASTPPVAAPSSAGTTPAA